jgi:hypothetical protein
MSSKYNFHKSKYPAFGRVHRLIPDDLARIKVVPYEQQPND